MTCSLFGKRTQIVRKRKKLNLSAVNENCVQNKSEKSFCGMEKYDANEGDDFSI